MSSKMDPKGQDSEQLWWFVTESTEGSKYDQRSKLLSEVRRKNPNFSDILSLLRLKGKPEDYNFWIHSPSMNAAVQLLKDTAINAIWTLYCRDDPTVTIIVRPASDHSPNASAAPSAKSSLAERRKVSEKRSVSEVFTRPDPRHVSQHFDPATQEPLKDLAESDKVQIDFGGGKYETFSKDYLIGWIQCEALNGKNITGITVEALTRNKRPIQFLLSKDVWMSSLLRGPHNKEFRDIWDREQEIQAQRSMALDYLFKKPNFTRSAMAFIRDLHHFGRDQEAQRRLNGTGHEFYMGLPYFGPDAVTRMLDLPLGKGTLQSALQDLVRRKRERNEADEICAAHDLAPVFEAALGLDWKDLKSNSGHLSSIENFPAESKEEIGKGKGLSERLRKDR